MLQLNIISIPFILQFILLIYPIHESLADNSDPSRSSKSEEIPFKSQSSWDSYFFGATFDRDDLPTDTTPPQITKCQADQKLTAGAGCSTATLPKYLLDHTGVSDNVDSFSDLTITQSPQEGSLLTPGSHTIFITVTDQAGNRANCNFTVNVKVEEKHVISGNQTACENQILEYELNAPYRTGSTYTWTITNGTVLSYANNKRKANIKWGSAGNGTIKVLETTASNCGGTKLKSEYSVAVNALAKPTVAGDLAINCPTATGNYRTSNTTTGHTYNWQVLDNQYTNNTSYTGNNINVIWKKEGQVSIKVTDNFPSGCYTISYITVTLGADNQKPQYSSNSCPPNITRTVATGANSVAVSWTEPTFLDNCASSSAINITKSHNSGDSFPIGTTTVRYDVTDGAGNFITCQFNVIIKDTEKPKLTNCPTTAFIKTVNNCNDVVVDYSSVLPTYSDNSGSVQVIPDPTHPSGSTFKVGKEETIKYRYKDPSGNYTDCTFKVFVKENIAPQFTSCPSDMTISADAGQNYATLNYTQPQAQDNCGAVTLKILNPAYASGKRITLGTGGSKTIQVEYEVADASGNKAPSNCVFNITIADTEPPVIQLPTNLNSSKILIVNTGSSTCSPNVNYSITATDNHGLASFQRLQGIAPNQPFPLGFTTIVYQAKDYAGNTKKVKFYVHVIDNAPPNVPNLVDVKADADINKCSGKAFWTLPTINDNCGGTVKITRVDSNTAYNSGDVFPVGITNIKYKFEDSNGNFVEKGFNVIIKDTQKPIFTQCPTDITVNASLSCDAIANFEAKVKDNCSGVVLTQTKGSPSGSSFPLGTTEIEFEAKDASGNTATCTFNVIVVDRTPPFMSVPTEISVNASANSCFTKIRYPFPKVSDNCPNFNTVVEITSGVGKGKVFPINTLNVEGKFPVGITKQSFKVIDHANNVTEKSFNIKVSDGETPSFTSCPSDMIVYISENRNGVCGAVVNYSLPKGTDNCNLSLQLVTGYASGSFFPAGKTRVEYMMQDSEGNKASCGFNIIVRDSVKLALKQLPDVFITVDAGKCNAIYSYKVVAKAGICEKLNIRLKSGIGSGHTYPLGENIEVIEAENIAGEKAIMSFKVIVVDKEAPSMKCADNITVESNPALCGAVVKFQPPAVHENCKNVSVKMVRGLPSGSVFPVGFTTIRYEAVDQNELKNECVFYVEVTDNKSPEVDCPADIEVGNDPGKKGAIVNYPYFTVRDGCQSGITSKLIEGKKSGSFFDIGEHLIRYQIMDADSNFTTCSFKIIVKNTVKIEIKQPKPVCLPKSVDITDSKLIVGNATGSKFEYYSSREDAKAGKKQLQHPDSLFTGSYFIKITSPTGATKITEMNVYTDDKPDASLFVSDPVFCSGGVAQIEVTGAEKNVIYQLIDPKTGTLIGSQVEGNGSKAILEIQPTKTTTYKVAAVSKYAKCYQELSDSAVVRFDNRLAGDHKVTGGAICANEEIKIKLYNSNPEVEYHLRYDSDDTDVTKPIKGTGGTIEFPIQPKKTTTYHILAVLVDGKCEGILTERPTVVVIGSSNDSVVVSDPKICQNSEGNIILQHTQPELTYALYDVRYPKEILQTKRGTSGDLAFTVSPTRNTTYNIRVGTDALPCSYVLKDPANVQIISPITNNKINSNQTICAGLQPDLLRGTTPVGGKNIAYRWEQSEDRQTWESAKGSYKKPDYQAKRLAYTTYFRRLVLAENCVDNISNVIEVKVNPSPKGGDLSGSKTVFKGKNKGRLILTNYSGEIIKWQFSNDKFIDNIQELNITNAVHSYLNITQTTWFRVVIRNETCGEVYSDTARIVATDKSAVNNNPIPINDWFVTEKDQSITQNVLDNDSDPNADFLIIKTQPVTAPVHGNVTIRTDGTFTYTPKVSYTGLDSFRYEVCDDRIDSVLCATAWVVISIETDDSDGDGIPNSVEKGENPSNPPDTDNDGTSNYLDLDSDGDGIPDKIEAGNIPRNPVDTDADGTPDYLDLDSDNDLILDKYEGWIDPTNPPDTDLDGILNFRDPDSDNDGIPDEYEGDGAKGNAPTDTDNDGIPDYMDLDSDGDERPDKQEAGNDPTNPVDRNQNGIPEFREPFEKLKIYNVFTPNQDGDNDIWHIDGITEYEYNMIRIFERDGMLVFEMKNYNNMDKVWRGQGNITTQKNLPNGTYYYQIDLGKEGKKQGFVVLKRQR